jgi:hypothetical protein
MIGGAFVALVLAVLWMLPPTTPLAPDAATNPRPVTQIARRASAAAEPAPAYPQSDVSFSPSLPPAAVYPPVEQSRRTAETLPAPRDGGDAEYADADPERAFERGYGWAARRDVQDPEECRRWEGTPREDGCLAYLRDVEDRAEADEAESDDPQG